MTMQRKMWSLCKTTSWKNTFFPHYSILQVSNSRRTARKKNKWAYGEDNKQAGKPGRKRRLFPGTQSFRHSSIKKERLQLNYSCRAGTGQPQALCAHCQRCQYMCYASFGAPSWQSVRLPSMPSWWGLRLAAWYLCLVNQASYRSAEAGGGKMISYLENKEKAKLRLVPLPSQKRQ